MKLKNPFFIAIFLSLLLHSFLFALKEHKKMSEQKVFEISFNDPRIDLKKIKEKLAPKIIPNQIVNTEQKGRSEEVDTRFLGKTNQHFDRQTIARKIDTFKEASKGKSNAQLKELSFEKLAFGKSSPENYSIPKKEKKMEETLGEESGKKQEKSLAQNNDYVQDVPLGEMTALNTTEFKYFGFYEWIRRQIEQFWGQSLQERARSVQKSGRMLASDTDSITALKISLDDRGNIVSIKVKNSSGIREFDDAAIESFNKAGPFPNPPRGMIKDGLAEIEFGFVVKS